MPTPIPNEDRKVIVEMLKNGCKPKEILKAVSVHRNTIYYIKKTIVNRKSVPYGKS